MEMRDITTAERKGYDALQAQILNMLGDLEKHLEESMQRMMDDEIAAAAAFAEWKILTEQEEVQLAADRTKSVAAAQDFQISAAEETQKLGVCEGQYTTQETNANQACGAFDSAQASFQRKEANKQSEIDLFG